MPVETVIAGPYTSTYAAVGIGMTRRGFELQHQTHGELINETDIYGDSLIDIVHRGLTCFIVTEARVFKAGSILPFYPWQPGGGIGDVGSSLFPAAGTRASDFAQPFAMTAVPATSASLINAGTGGATGISTLTATKAILPPNSNLSLLFDSRARSVPLRLFLMPVTNGAYEQAFVTG